MKTLCVLLAAALLGLSLAAPAQETALLQVGALKGPTAMGLVELMARPEGGADYAFTLAASPDALLPALARGELDLACLPVNLAAILYANTQGAVRVVAVNTLGVLYILQRGEGIKTLADLAGRRLYSSGKASTPEYALNHLLERAGVQDVDIQWKSEHAEVLASLLLDPEGAALLPQPFVAAALRQNPDIRVALDLNALWEALGEGPMITGVTVARAELIERQPERLAVFLKDYAVSVDYVNNHNEEAAQLMERFGIISAPVALDALPFCGITLVTGAEMARALQAFYQAMFTQDPRATGGSLPDEAFYYLP